eukprot:142572-Pelagomonas_calceolata.AAC.1
MGPGGMASCFCSFLLSRSDINKEAALVLWYFLRHYASPDCIGHPTLISSMVKIMLAHDDAHESLHNDDYPTHTHTRARAQKIKTTQFKAGCAGPHFRPSGRASREVSSSKYTYTHIYTPHSACPPPPPDANPAEEQEHDGGEGHVLSLILTPPPDAIPPEKQDHGRSCSGGGSDDSNAKDGEDAGGAGQPSLSMHGNKGRGKAVCAKLEGAQAVGNGWDGERAEHWASDGGSSYKYRSRGGLRLDDEVNWRGEGMKLGD